MGKVQRLLRIFHSFFIIFAFTYSVHAQTPASPPDTYWNGAGDTPGMEHYRQSGNLLRYSQFPVRVYLSPNTESRWQQALSHAIQQLDPIVPVFRVSYPAQANLWITVLSPATFVSAAPCDTDHTDGCGGIYPIGLPGEPGFHVEGHLWIRADSPIPAQHLILHEMIHALGLLVHSPDPGDVMYNGSDAAPTMLSARDRATLLYLYQQPTWEP